MSESGDYTPVSWGGHHDFTSARAHYDKHVGRSYDDAVAAGKPAKDLLPESISTKSTSPIIINCDQTGSMGDWPATIFSKLPYLYHEASTEYFDKDVEFSFGATGDARNAETYPLQVRPFDKGEDLKKRLEDLVIEGKGGGQIHETYEMSALYYARNVSMPKAIKPILIMIGDELPYDHVTKAQAAMVHVKLEGKMISTKEIFDELKEKYAVYFILKPYGSGGRDDDPTNATVRNGWLNLLDEDHIAYLPTADRVVDVIFGIFAKETGKIPYFKKEIESRQKPAQVATAYKALRTIHVITAGTKGSGTKSRKKLNAAGKSTMFKGAGKGKKTDDLI